MVVVPVAVPVLTASVSQPGIVILSLFRAFPFTFLLFGYTSATIWAVRVVLKSPTKDRKSSRDYVRKFRAKVAEDPEVHEIRRQVVNEQNRAFYNRMTPEQREKHQARCRKNQKAYRDRKKAERTAQTLNAALAGKPLTRKETQEVDQKRKKMATYMREYRKNLSRQKRAAINKTRMEKYYSSKETEVPAAIPDQPTTSHTHSESHVPHADEPENEPCVQSCHTPTSDGAQQPASSPWAGLTAIIESAIESGLAATSAASPTSGGPDYNTNSLASVIKSAVMSGLSKIRAPTEPPVSTSNTKEQGQFVVPAALSGVEPVANAPTDLPEVSASPTSTFNTDNSAPIASWSGIVNIIPDHHVSAEPSSSNNIAVSTTTEAAEGKKPKASFTKGALKKARQRVRKILGEGDRAAVVLKGIIKSAKKDSKESFAKFNISAQTPEKDKRAPKATKKATARQLFSKPKSKAATIATFYKENSIPLPHKRTVSTKKKIEKRVLDVPVRKLYKQFINEHPHQKVSKSTFYRHRPRNISLYTKFPLITCLCDICQNMQLKLNVLNKYIPSSERMADKWDLYKNLLCPCSDKDADLHCIEMKCKHCGPEVFRDKLLLCLDKLKGKFVVWKKWESVEEEGKKRKMLKEVTGSLSRMLSDLVWECRETKFSSHVFTARWQKSQFHFVCNNVPADAAVLVLDFAENYRCIVQGEIQSAYYSYKQVTVHPCVSYYACASCGERINDYCIFVSDDVKHDAHFSQRCQESVVSYLKGKGINKVFIFSDGASSQYKSKVPFAYLTELSKMIHVERCFFGSRHGKNPCDAAGGIVKSCAENAVKCGHAHIQCASDFFDYCSKALSLTANCSNHVNRKFYLIDNVNRSVDIPQFSTLPGTRKLHSIKYVGGAAFITRNLSCFCNVCLSSSASTKNCLHSNYVNEWEKVKLKDGRDIDNGIGDRGMSDDGDSLGDDTLNKAFVDAEEDLTVPPFLDIVDRVSFFKHLQQQLRTCSTFSELTRLCKTVLPCFERFSLEPQNICVSECDAVVDVHACSFRPGALLSLFPVETIGDGNCMPRAVSRACFGVEDYHCELRCRIVVELCFHKSHYLSFLPQNDIMQIALLSPCSEGFDLFDINHLGDIYEAEVLYTSTLTRTLGLWQLSALSSVTGCKIVSVYPALGPPQYRKLFDQCLSPRVERHNQVLTVMWTSSREDMPSEYWVANHVVPLLPLGNNFTVVWDE